MDADMRQKKFTFRQNQIRVNDLALGFSGSAIMAEDRTTLDMAFNSPRTDFRHILSLVPAIYSQSFQTIKTSGALALSGQIKGDSGKTAFPSFSVDAKVTNGAFQYPDLPLPARDIVLDLSLRN